MDADWETPTRESYDRVTQPYAEMTRSAVAGDTYLTSTYSVLALAARAVAGADAAVVDVGCGPGWWLQYLVEQGVNAAGIDLSKAMVDLARLNAPTAHVEVGSVLDIPLPSASAAGVACMYVLHHVPDHDLDRAVDELLRVLVPGGVLLIGGHIGSRRAVKTEGYGGHPMHVQINTRPAAEWEAVVRRAGLVIEAHTTFDPDGPSPTHALFARRPPA